MARIALFPLLLIAACLIAGSYGALHNQISYTVSPDYFHAFKFHQFQVPEDFRGRVGASIVGWRASWWMGLIVSVPILLVGLILPGPRAYVVGCLTALLFATGTALVMGLGALVYGIFTITAYSELRHFPAGVVDRVAFERAGTMHNFSYLGGFTGIITGSLYLFSRRTRIYRGAFDPTNMRRRPISRKPSDQISRKLPYTILRTINDSEGKRRVFIVRRDNGTFGYEVEYWSDDPYEQCWITCGQYPFCICDSEEIALREAMGRVDWLAGYTTASGSEE